MPKITVTEAKEVPRQGKPSFWVIKDQTEAEFTLWDTKYLEVLQPGNVVDIDIDIKGRFINIKSAELVQRSMPIDNSQVAPTSHSPLALTKQVTDQELRAEVLKAAAYGGLTGDKAVVMAEHYMRYIREGRPYAEDCRRRLIETDGSGDGQGTAFDANYVPPSQVDPETIDSYTELFRLTEKYWGKTSDQIVHELGYQYESDLIETPKDAWRQLLAIFGDGPP